MERFTGRIDANSKWNKFEYGMMLPFHGLIISAAGGGQYASALYSLENINWPSFHTYL